MNEKACLPASSPDPIDIAIGTRLRLRRLALGLSQETLARALGVTFQQIQKYERGTNRVFASRLYHLSRILRVPPSYFFEDITSEGELPAGSAVVSPSLEAERKAVSDLLEKSESLKLVRAYNRIGDPGVRRQIYALVKTVGEQDGLENRFR